MIQELEDIKKTKLCYIEDINKAHTLLHKKSLSVENFDYLYDQPIDILEHILYNLELTLSLVESLTVKD